MSFLPEIANPYVAAIVGGFVYGLFYCTSTCLPYVASYIAGINADFRKGVSVTVIFNAGRITAYALIGAAVGALKLLADQSVQSAFQTYGTFVFSIVSIIVGIVILMRKPSAHNTCVGQNMKQSNSKRLLGSFDLQAYSLGLTRGLILCTPMLYLLAYSATFASPLDNVALAVLFGVGTAISPIILIGGATGWLLNKAPLFRVWISRLGGIALIVLGAITLYIIIK
jgi:cytochrome c-type biogenesis protein